MEKLPSPPTPENIEGQVEQILEELYNMYRLDQFPEEIQDRLEDEWYTAEEMARNGEYIYQGLVRLRQFVDKLSKTPKKK